MDVKVQIALKKCGYQKLRPYQDEVNHVNCGCNSGLSQLIGMFNKV